MSRRSAFTAGSGSCGPEPCEDITHGVWMVREWSCVTCDHSVTSSDQSMWARYRVASVWVFVSLLAWAGPQSGNKPAEAEKESPEPVYELGEGITPPRLIRQVNPEYSGKK